MKSDRTLGLTRKLLLYAAWAAALLTPGCAEEIPKPPYSLAQYERMRATSPGAYPLATLRLRNLQRVLDADLSPEQRLASFELLRYLGADEPSIHERLSLVLTEEGGPYQLHHAVLTFLLEQDYPGLAGYVVPALAKADQDPSLREAILQWLMRHPSPAVLSEIVRLWADEPSAVSANEPRYRHIVERITGRPWDEALLAAINNRQTFARGRALEILAARLPHSELARKIMQLQPETSAMAALQSFFETFDYLPSRRAEFAALVTIFKTRLEMISDVVRLTGQWRDDYGYQFNIRDFHLLARLARDPLRVMLRRTQLILELSRSLRTRQHVRYRPRGRGGRIYTDRFALLADSLTISDLWNIYLLNEMLSRPRVQLALRIIAEGIRRDPTSASCGLVFYRHGQAEAMLYPPAKPDPGRPGRGVSRRMVRDGRDSLCRFYTNFAKVQNASKAGPDAEQLLQANKDGFYGVILTSVNEYAFCAHYYSPGGQVVSLGKFPFRK